MAKLKFGAIVVSGSGSLGGQTIGKNRGSYILQNKSVSKKTPSLKQVQQRSSTKKIMALWGQVNDFQKINYGLLAKLYSKNDVFGDNVNYTAFGIFQKLNQGLLQIGQDAILIASEYSVPTPPIQLNVNVVPDALTIQSNYYKANDIIAIYASTVISKGTSNPRKYMRKIGYATSTELENGIDIITNYINIFGVPVIGTNVFFGFKTYSSISGFSNGSLVINDNANIVGGNTLLNANVRLIVGDKNNLQTVDIAMYNFMLPLVNSVTYVSDESTNVPPFLDITVVSQTVNSGLTGSLKTQNTPIITMEGGNFDELSMATTGADTTSIENAVVFNTHPILAGVSSPFNYNSPAVSTRQGSMSKGGAISPNSRLIYGGSGSEWYVLAYNTNDILQDSTLAVNKRIFIAGYNAQLFSSTTNLIWKNALNWCYGSL